MNDLLERVADAGFDFDTTAAVPRLVPRGKDVKLPPALLEEVRVNRAEILAHLATARETATDPEEESTRCKVCRATLFTRDTSRLADPALCDRGGAKEVRNRAGKVVVPAEPRCPYKPRATWG